MLLYSKMERGTVNKRFGILVLAISTALAPSVHAADKTPIRFIMDWAFEGAQSIWPVAAESGCFSDSGLEVTIDRSLGSGDAISKVASRTYDIGVADFTSLVNYNASHPGDKLIATLVISERAPTSIMTLKKNGIAKPQDLIGKRIADTQGEASRVLFPAFAKANNIDPGNVTWVSVTPNLRQPILIKGDSDAVAGHLFTITIGLRALGVKDEEMVALPYADWGAQTLGNSVIARPEWATGHPEVMRAFVKCAIFAVKKSIADPAGAIAALKKYNSLVNEKLELESLGFSNSRAILTDNVKKNGISSFSAQRLDQVLGQISDALGIAKPAGNEVWTATYLPSSRGLMLQ
jgi:NitT/TauT family transport system substrate-binding protein